MTTDASIDGVIKVILSHDISTEPAPVLEQLGPWEGREGEGREGERGGGREKEGRGLQCDNVDRSYDYSRHFSLLEFHKKGKCVCWI